MSTYQVELTQSAVKDLEQISDFYFHTADEQVVERLLQLLEQAFSLLKKLPERGVEVPLLNQETGRHYQQLLAEPFRLVYRVEQHKVFVVMVLHQRQSIQKALKNRLLR